jgi:type IV secretion system protein VirB10
MLSSLGHHLRPFYSDRLGAKANCAGGKELNIKPTMEIGPGYQFNIIVTKDVIFRTAYAAN